APDGALWLCDFDAVVRWHGGVATHVSDPTITGRPSVAYTDSRGRVWIGFWDGGIVSIRDGRFDGYPAGNGLARGRGSNTYEDSEHGVWVSTLGGVSRFDERGRFESLPDNDPLSRFMVQTIIEDDQHRMWISGVWGLARFDRSDFEKALHDPSHRVQVWSAGPA